MMEPTDKEIAAQHFNLQALLSNEALVDVVQSHVAIDQPPTPEVGLRDTKWVRKPPAGTISESSRKEVESRICGIRCVVLDLSIEEDAIQYSKLLNSPYTQDSNELIVEEERHWCDVSCNWCVYIRVATMEFKMK